MAAYQTSFESLGDRRFQLFVQSLLSYEFPDLQAFPVGQRDGGRDAVTLAKASEFIAFQVKFVERPDYLKDVDNWLSHIVAAERKNIEWLVGRGASKYFLITNLPGSAHADTGSMDRASKLLGDLLPIPSQILWRNDLEIRLAKHRNLKWHYRELLSGSDVIDELVASGLSEDRNRRRDAVVASLSTQYEADSSVRFKQVDLQNDLLDLFVDVPLGVPVRHMVGLGTIQARQLARRRNVLTTRHHYRAAIDSYYLDGEARGAADILLREPARPIMTRTVIEGAPGQGKSTLAQYLCQVHRMHLLKKTQDIRRLPEAHRGIGRRLPFKVDLRELATFFRGDDPFASVTQWGGLPDSWPRSLEGFLAAQVTRYSGGADFSVSDLLAIARTGPILLVLDGLDEVAEIADRKIVVETVEQGLAALMAGAASLQVIVTSRPPAFANSPGFSEKEYGYAALTSLSPELIFDYTRRWGLSRKLTAEEQDETADILKAKLDEPHMSELAQNPMQLAILLSLIHTRGESLPDKRTQLYQGYMDLYFAREASKSRLVKKHRDLLYGLHGHLGWLLHVGAERNAEHGSIALDDLKREVVNYLHAHGESPELAEKLFRGVVERIIALVATRQERFEFAVQPLREFFAAKHLYATAQVSQLGKERPGTRANRFDALARDAFWLNVVRFYAGFYDSGELPSLADRLEAIAQDSEFVLTDHPRTLTAMLLADWSFALDKRSRERAIEVATAGLGERHTMESGTEVFVLPSKSGREQVADACVRILDGDGVSNDRRRALRRTLGNHVDHDAFAVGWRKRVLHSSGRRRTEWLDFGAQFGFMDDLAANDSERFIDGDHDPDLGRRCRMLVERGVAGPVERSERFSQAALRAMATWPLGEIESLRADRANGSVLERLAVVLYAGARGFLGLGGEGAARSQDVPPYLVIAEKLVALGGTYQSPDDPSSHLREVAELLRGIAEEPWTAVSVAVTTASGWRRRTPPRSAPSLVDESVPLFDRVVAARMRSGASYGSWWRGQAGAATTSFQRAVVLLGALLWSTGDALATNWCWLDATVNELEDEDVTRVAEIVESAMRRSIRRRTGLPRTRLKSMSQRLAAIYLPVVSYSERVTIWELRLARYRGADALVLGRCLELWLESARTNEDWRQALRVCRRAMANGDAPETPLGSPIPSEVAKAVVEDARRYPLWLVQAAEEALEPPTTTRFAVGAVARRERWFMAD